MSNVFEDLSFTGTRNTRGYGFLEPFLAKQRAQIADQLIPKELRQGRILDAAPILISSPTHTSRKNSRSIS